MIQLLEDVFAVHVRVNAVKFEDTKANGIMWRDTEGYYDSIYFDEHFNDNERFIILGTVTETEIDFDVDTVSEYIGEPESVYYDTPEDSFRSLLTSKGIQFVNPYQQVKGKYWGDIETLNKWREAQSNLVQKLVIIKKVS